MPWIEQIFIFCNINKFWVMGFHSPTNLTRYQMSWPYDYAQSMYFQSAYHSQTDWWHLTLIQLNRRTGKGQGSPGALVRCAFIVCCGAQAQHPVQGSHLHCRLPAALVLLLCWVPTSGRRREENKPTAITATLYLLPGSIKKMLWPGKTSSSNPWPPNSRAQC